MPGLGTSPRILQQSIPVFLGVTGDEPGRVHCLFGDQLAEGDVAAYQLSPSEALVELTLQGESGLQGTQDKDFLNGQRTQALADHKLSDLAEQQGKLVVSLCLSVELNKVINLVLYS